VARVVLAPRVQDDIDRIFNFVFEHAPDSAVDRVSSIISAIDILETSPRIGRPTDGGKRELVIATGAGGCVALYRYVPELDTVFVLAIRSQREADYGQS
jgi:toxin ParE1/3/4